MRFLIYASVFYIFFIVDSFLDECTIGDKRDVESVLVRTEERHSFRDIIAKKLFALHFVYLIFNLIYLVKTKYFFPMIY